MKNEKGITLVVLIFAALALIILSGISIALVISDRNSQDVVPSTPTYQTPVQNTEVVDDFELESSIDVTPVGEDVVKEMQNVIANEIEQ